MCAKRFGVDVTSKNNREVFDFKSLSEAVRLFLYYSLDAGGSG